MTTDKAARTTFDVDAFATDVSVMRSAQKDYFKTRTPEALQHAKRAEAAVDYWLSLLRRGDPKQETLL